MKNVIMGNEWEFSIRKFEVGGIEWDFRRDTEIGNLAGTGIRSKKEG